MPLAEDILEGLRQTASDWQILAVLWHVYFAIFVLALMAGHRASRRLLAVLLAMPLLSVSVLAWVGANPFNGTVFALAATALTAVGAQVGQGKVELASMPRVVAGTLMFAFGWVYPHFITHGSAISYLYAAPTGLIPCPTLSAVAGLTLILGGFGSLFWSIIVGMLGLFYGFYGAVTLGVTIDWILFAGAICVLVACAGDYRKRYGGTT